MPHPPGHPSCVVLLGMWLTDAAALQGAYTGPLVNSEFMAALLASVVFYVAFSTRSALQA